MVGTCQVPYDEADQVLNELVESIHSESRIPLDNLRALNPDELDDLISGIQLQL